jgi:hypothetical protein
MVKDSALSAVILIGLPPSAGNLNFRHSSHLNKLRPSTPYKGVTKNRALRTRVFTMATINNHIILLYTLMYTKIYTLVQKSVVGDRKNCGKVDTRIR